MKKLLVPLLVCAALVAGIALLAFPPRDEMRHAVQDFGFRDVQLTGFSLFGCAEQDTYRQRWSGKSAAGKPVQGVVCGGLTKGWTVRLT